MIISYQKVCLKADTPMKMNSKSLIEQSYLAFSGGDLSD
jgi:hypothetical protein